MAQKHIIDPPWPFATKQELEEFIEDLESYEDSEDKKIQETLEEARTRLRDIEENGNPFDEDE